MKPIGGDMKWMDYETHFHTPPARANSHTIKVQYDALVSDELIKEMMQLQPLSIELQSHVLHSR